MRQCVISPAAAGMIYVKVRSRPEPKRTGAARQTVPGTGEPMLIATITSVMVLPRGCVLGAGMAWIHQTVVVAVMALALALAGQARAMALVHSSGGTEMVICSDEGMKTIYLGAGGAPAESPADCWNCPACFGTPAIATPPTPVGPASPDVTAVSRTQPAGQVLLPSRYLRPETRGPPQAAHGIHDLAPAAVSLLAEGGHSTGKCHRIGRPLMEARI